MKLIDYILIAVVVGLLYMAFRLARRGRSCCNGGNCNCCTGKCDRKS